MVPALPDHFFRWFLNQAEPGVLLGQHEGFLPFWTYPWWVAKLQIESAFGEHRGEVKLPVEEALPLRYFRADRQPRVLGQYAAVM